jgi:hypothetical protein
MSNYILQADAARRASQDLHLIVNLFGVMCLLDDPPVLAENTAGQAWLYTSEKIETTTINSVARTYVPSPKALKFIAVQHHGEGIDTKRFHIGKKYEFQNVNVFVLYKRSK